MPCPLYTGRRPAVAQLGEHLALNQEVWSFESTPPDQGV